MSLGQYLQPGGMEESLASQPLSDSEEEEEGAVVEAGERSVGFSWDQVVQANTGELPPLQQVSWSPRDLFCHKSDFKFSSFDPHLLDPDSGE